MGRRWGMVLLVVVLVVAVGGGLGLPVGVLADATYTVCPTFATVQADVQGIAGTGTLTFMAANCTLTATSTITTQAGSDVTIAGNGLTLSGGTSGSPGTFDLIDLGSGANLTLDQTTLAFGHNGIFEDSEGSISLTNSTISGNGADGLFQSSGTVTLTNSTSSGNHYNGIDQDYGSITLSNSTLRDNGADGIAQERGSATLINSTLRDNGADGIFQDSGDSVTLTNSTLSNNHLGGIDQENGSISLTNSTLSGNEGNGIYQSKGTVTLTNSTLSGSSDNGIYEFKGTVIVTASLLAGNVNENCHIASLTDQGYNLSDDASCGFSATGSQNSVSTSALNLGTLGDYGGPTQTIPLLPGSVAIDAIPTGPLHGASVCLNASGQPIVDPVSEQPLTTDQRGVARPQMLGCDVGAYERAVPASTDRAALTIMNVRRPTIQAFVVTNVAGSISGSLRYQDSSVNLNRVMLLSLVVNGNQATVYGTAELADGTPVNFVLQAQRASFAGKIRLQLSNGYDSGWQSVLIVQVSAGGTHSRFF